MYVCMFVELSKIMANKAKFKWRVGLLQLKIIQKQQQQQRNKYGMKSQ